MITCLIQAFFFGPGFRKTLWNGNHDATVQKWYVCTKHYAITVNLKFTAVISYYKPPSSNFRRLEVS